MDLSLRRTAQRILGPRSASVTVSRRSWKPSPAELKADFPLTASLLARLFLPLPCFDANVLQLDGN